MSFALAFALLPAASRAQPQAMPGWKSLADCAAAYRVNSEISDPDRAPSMKAMIADQSNDYRTAATRSYRRQHPTAKAGAGRSVRAYIARRAQAFSRQPRAAIDHFIDACPQAAG